MVHEYEHIGFVVIICGWFKPLCHTLEDSMVHTLNLVQTQVYTRFDEATPATS